jgi:hypothetical protein
MTGRIALAARTHLSWPAVALVGLLSLLLAAALTQGLRALDGVFSSAPAVSSAAPSVQRSSLPAAARASISATIGAGELAYHFDATRGGARAGNPAQRLSVGVSQAGVRIERAGLDLGLSLRALGYASTLQPLSNTQPSVAANRVDYVHSAVDEWYVNGPFGLEQGFTLTHAPASAAPTPSAPLTLAIALAGNARAALARGGQSVTFTAADGSVLRYAGLSARDASGRALHSWLTLGSRELLLHVDARDARFPLRIDPELAAPEARLVPTTEEPEEGDEAGLSVALSADGNTALVGAPGGKLSIGAVWVFTRSAGKWQELQKLEAPEIEGGADVCAEASTGSGEEGEECRFGRAVALSGNGQEALIGAPLANSQGGAAWIYTRSGSTFKAAAELTSPQPSPQGHFGRSVALSESGETALVGAPGELKFQGRAWVFSGSGASWAVDAPLAGAGEQGSGRFGRSVALAGDGETALVGAPADDNLIGAAWVFQRAGVEWQEQGPKLIPVGEEISEAHFGHSLALSANGSTAVVGANEYRGGLGAIWTYSRTGTSWSELGPMIEGGSQAGTAEGGEEGKEKTSEVSESPEEFGSSVALSAAGNGLIVGAANYKDYRGAAWLYELSSSTWGSPLRRLEREAGRVHKARFGYSVAMSANGETELVGGPTETGKGGAAWVFGHAPIVESIEPNSGTTAGGTEVTIVGWNLTAATAVRFGATAAPAFALNPGEHSLTAEAPPGKVGTVDITVETPLGISAVSEKDQFSYVPPSHKSGKGGGGGSGGGGGGPQPGNAPENPPSTGIPMQVGTEAVLALGPVSSPACGASLLSKNIAVQANDHALFKLLGTGTGKCAGKLRLRVEIKLANKHLKLKTIGVAVFAIAAGKRVSVSVKLGAVGRALLRTGHGRLTGNLLLVKQSPLPFVSRTASVRLALQRPKPKHKL